MQIPAGKKNIFLQRQPLRPQVLSRKPPREKNLWFGWMLPRCSRNFLLGDLFDFGFEYKAVVPKRVCTVLENWLKLVTAVSYLFL